MTNTSTTTAPIQTSGVPAYFLGRPNTVYLEHYRARGRRRADTSA
jgi:hypothetical protein